MRVVGEQEVLRGFGLLRPATDTDLTPITGGPDESVEVVDAPTERDPVAEVLAAHRINYRRKNVGGETASTLRYTSCEGCDWLGGHHDEAGWEAHVAEQIAPLIAERVRNAEAIARLAEESEAGWRREADDLAERVRAARAEAWEEGWQAGMNDMNTYSADDNTWVDTPNPYREAAKGSQDAQGAAGG